MDKKLIKSFPSQQELPLLTGSDQSKITIAFIAITVRESGVPGMVGGSSA